MRRLDKEEVESSRWLFYATDGRTRKPEGRLQEGLPEAPVCSHSLGNTYWVEILGSLLTAVPPKCLQCGQVWRQEDGDKTLCPKRSQRQTEALLIPCIFLAHFQQPVSPCCHLLAFSPSDSSQPPPLAPPHPDAPAHFFHAAVMVYRRGEDVSLFTDDLWVSLVTDSLHPPQSPESRAEGGPLPPHPAPRGRSWARGRGSTGEGDKYSFPLPILHANHTHAPTLPFCPPNTTTAQTVNVRISPAVSSRRKR